MFVIHSVLEANSWTYRIKTLNGGDITGNFYEKELLLSKLQMSYYPEPDSDVRDKIKVVLDFSDYATKKVKQCYRY